MKATSQRKPARKSKGRKSEIVRELSRLSRNGWENAKPEDYEPLEAELKKL